jgi:hypothetical protein
MVVFVDEVGSNTSQEGDGAIGGELKIFAKGLVPRESATINNHHFTVLGFTAATGEAIMCAIIVLGKSLKPEVVTDIDVFSKKIGDESDFISQKRILVLVKDTHMAQRVTSMGKMCPASFVTVKVALLHLNYWWSSSRKWMT